MGLILVENGYIFKDLSIGNIIYYEFYGSYFEKIKEFVFVDVVIFLVISLNLLLVGLIIKGNESVL